MAFTVAEHYGLGFEKQGLCTVIVGDGDDGYFGWKVLDCFLSCNFGGSAREEVYG